MLLEDARTKKMHTVLENVTWPLTSPTASYGSWISNHIKNPSTYLIFSPGSIEIESSE